LRRTGPLALFDPHVVSRLTPNGAELDVFVDVENASSSHQEAELSFDLGGRRFSKVLYLSPRERLEVRVGADEEAALRLARPRLWWPRRLGTQELYDLDVGVRCHGRLSDHQTLRFGVREITCELDEREHALFRVNGRPLLVRGGGWANDLFLRRNPERERREYEYVKHIGLNAIRFEGMLPDDDFLDRCDADGVLVIAGFCCCDHWEKWGSWKAEDHAVAASSLRSQVRRLRHHASLASFWYGSDFPPPREVEERYLAVLEAEHWPNPGALVRRRQADRAHRTERAQDGRALRLRAPVLLAR
jgi:exo-1,4-beta-D-glucosaminidase